MLDRLLVENGQDVTLSRVVSGATSSVVCRCRVRGGDTVASDGHFGKAQGEFRLILSPTEINAAGWPGGTPVGAIDQRVPVNQDHAVINGHVRTVQVATGFYMDNVLVRIEALVVG
ncbi:MAG: hypothetical protein JWO51_151 [Rhodospirillales bacterium]|nr:hypothetical protein [Rhodospirillales bacterium]